MSAFTVPSVRHSLRTCSRAFRSQRRWARVHDIRFVATHRDQTQILEKYKTKLERKAKEEGHGSVDDLKEAYKEKITEYRRSASVLEELKKAAQQQLAGPQASSSGGLQQPPPPPPSAQPSPQQNSTSTSPKAPSSSTSSSGGAPGIKPLSSYVDLEKLMSLPRKEIEYIWRLRFASNPLSLCAVIPFDVYQRIYTNARAHPQFILPLPRPSADDGSDAVKSSDTGFDAAQPRTAADIHFLQWGFHPPSGEPPAPGNKTSNTHVSTVLFTHLAAFKVHGAYSQPHTTVTHHLDLADSHGIVLLQGAVVEGRGVNPDEATWLLMCLQKFYDFEGHGGGIGREKRQGLLQKFSQGDTSGFRLDELMNEAERVS